jgi:hypothetical protein
MRSRNLIRGFLLLWLVTGLVLLIGSIDTVRFALGSPGHSNPHLALLGGVEAIAAALFFLPVSMRLGAVGLLFTIVIAFAVHVFLHQFRPDLLLYAAAVSFVGIHGPLTREQMRVVVGPAGRSS